MIVEEVIRKARELVVPSAEDEQKLKKVANVIRSRLELFKNEMVRWEFGGSYAHGTWLPEEADIDVFLLFPPELGPNVIAEKGMEVAKKALEPFESRIRYAEHPYLEGFVEEVRVNLVPCADVERGKWITAADRSPHHTRFMLRSLDGNMKNEVRLLKKFLKAQGLYGAEIKIKGFSGYVTEVLIVKYGSFLKVLENVSNWKRGEVIAFGDEDRIRAIHRDSWLIISDPVDPARNLAKAISPQKIARFILLSRAFIENPDISYFTEYKKYRAKIDLEDVLCLTFKVPKKVDDILWGELWKTVKAINKQMNMKGYNVIKSSVASNGDEACIAILLDRKDRKLEVRRGPEIFLKEDVKRFLKKHGSDSLLWIGEDLRIYSLRNYRLSRARDALEEIVSKPIEHGIAKGLSRYIKEYFRIVEGDALKKAKGVIKEALFKLEVEDVPPYL